MVERHDFSVSPPGRAGAGDLIRFVEAADNWPLLDIADRIAVMAFLADIASAIEETVADQFLEILDRRRIQGAAWHFVYAFYLSHLLLRREDYYRAAEIGDSGRTDALSRGWEAEASGFCVVLGTVHHKLGKYTDARRAFEEAIVAARRAGSRQLEGRAAMNLGLTLKNSGQLDEAERLLRFAYDIAKDVPNSSNTARCALNLTTVLIRKGAWAEAMELARYAVEIFDSLGLRGFANTARIALARATRLTGDSLLAMQILEVSLEEARNLGKPRNVVLALEFLGDCGLDLQDPLSARDRFSEALLLARSHGNSSDLVVECLRGLALSEVACGDQNAALEHVQESIRLAREQGDTFELETSLLGLADVQRIAGKAEEELLALQEARKLAGQIGDDYGRAKASLALAKHGSMRGSSVDALVLAAEAHRVALRIGSPWLAKATSDFLEGVTKFKARDAQSISTNRGIVEPGIAGFVTADARTIRTLATVRTLAPRRLNILIHGESGTGKELIAQAVHRESGRKGPFVPVNCSAFPGDLIEGELFGHARGAYTGADRERAGLFEHAHNGTLFLDEIGDMPIKAQARLLRALESGEVRRLGENNPRLVDVRIVAATHRDLMTMVGAGDFRLDLYYRLAGYVVELPPLRERREDAKLLIDHYFSKFAGEQGKSLIMTPEVRQQLASHSWPGNVRELRLVVERLVSLSEDGATIATLPFALEGAPSPRSLPELLEAEEKRRILEALQSHNWNKQRAAMTLGTNRTTLIGKMKRMGIASRKP